VRPWFCLQFTPFLFSFFYFLLLLLIFILFLPQSSSSSFLIFSIFMQMSFLFTHPMFPFRLKQLLTAERDDKARLMLQVEEAQRRERERLGQEGGSQSDPSDSSQQLALLRDLSEVRAKQVNMLFAPIGSKDDSRHHSETNG